MRFIFLILFIVSCGKADKWPACVDVDKTINKKLSDTLKTYTTDLNQELKEQAFLIGPKPKKYTIRVSYSNEPSPIGAAGTATRYFNSCSVVIYPIALERDLLKTVLWHEYGHCLGLEHESEAGEIMSPIVGDFSAYPRSSVNLFLYTFKQFLLLEMR